MCNRLSNEREKEIQRIARGCGSEAIAFKTKEVWLMLSEIAALRAENEADRQAFKSSLEFKDRIIQGHEEQIAQLIEALSPNPTALKSTPKENSNV